MDFFGWWGMVVDLFWVVVGSGRFILGDGGWWWVISSVVSGGGYILGSGGGGG